MRATPTIQSTRKDSPGAAEQTTPRPHSRTHNLKGSTPPTIVIIFMFFLRVLKDEHHEIWYYKGDCEHHLGSRRGRKTITNIPWHLFSMLAFSPWAPKAALVSRVDGGGGACFWSRHYLLLWPQWWGSIPGPRDVDCQGQTIDLYGEVVNSVKHK